MKKLTVIISDETFDILKQYCDTGFGKRIYYRRVVECAIKYYCIENTANFSRIFSK